MFRKAKRPLSLILAIAFVVALCPIISFAAPATQLVKVGEQASLSSLTPIEDTAGYTATYNVSTLSNKINLQPTFTFNGNIVDRTVLKVFYSEAPDGTTFTTPVEITTKAFGKDANGKNDKTIVSITKAQSFTAKNGAIAKYELKYDTAFSATYTVNAVRVNLNNLEKAIADAKVAAGNELKYTPNSWTAADIATALAAAETAYDSLSVSLPVTQKEVNQAANKLNAALAKLVDRADFDALKLAISKAEALDENLYTPSSWTANKAEIDSALAAAQAINFNDTQITVDAALLALNTAMDKLVLRADKDGLKVLIERAEDQINNHGDEYTPSSIAALQPILDAAKVVFDNQDATDAEVKAAMDALDPAIDALVERADLTALQSALEAAVLTEEDYTPASWSVLQSAVATGTGLLTNFDATQTEVNDATDAILAATAALVVRADFTALNAAIVAAKAIDLTPYTAASGAALTTAIGVAETEAANFNLTQAEVNSALAALNGAVAGLEIIIATSELEAIIAEIKALDPGSYTSASMLPLLAALPMAEQVLALPNPTQTQIDNQVTLLKDLMNNLVSTGITIGVTVPTESSNDKDVVYAVNMSGDAEINEITITFQVDANMVHGHANGDDVSTLVPEAITDLFLIPEEYNNDNWVNVSGSLWTYTFTLKSVDGYSAPQLAKIIGILLVPQALGDCTLTLTEVKAIRGAYNVPVTIDPNSATTKIVTPSAPIDYDLNDDGLVNFDDYVAFSSFYGAKDGDANWDTAKAADFNGDGIVDSIDMLALFANIK